MKIFAILLSLLLTQICLAQFKVTKLDKNSIPAKIKYNGDIVEAVRWTDSTGDNVVMLTTKKTESKTVPAGLTGRALNAFHYLVLDDNIKQTWGVYDYVEECSVDMFLYFVDKTFAVTDLNKDGKAEVWMMYKVSCQGDVSPVPMKIIMYQDNKKFAVRGTSRISGHNHGGEFTFDKAFKKAPAAFRKYAENLWKQHKIETFNQ
jgi:hypothetical protein